MKEIDLATLRRTEAYGFMISFIVPRAIALVSTRDAQGHVNLAPFSYFTGLGSDPPMVVLGIANQRDGREKDTLRLARQTGVFCVNLVEEELAEQTVKASGDWAPDVDEMALVGLVAEPCRVIDCVRVKEARASIECRLVDVHGYGNKAKTNLVVAEVVHATVAEEILLPSGIAIDPAKVAPLARLGGAHYARLGERLVIERPRVGDPRGSG